MPWPWPLYRSQRLRVVFVSFLLYSILHPATEQREQWRRLQQKRKATLVANRLSDAIHACRSAGAHAGQGKR